jgi:hypothetical protein
MSVSKGVSKGRLDYAIAKTEPEMLTFDVPVSQAEKDFFLSSMTAVAKGITGVRATITAHDANALTGQTARNTPADACAIRTDEQPDS